MCFFFFSSRRRHTRSLCDWSSDVCSSDLGHALIGGGAPILVQSMTNTDTADLQATATQVAELARAGSEEIGRACVGKESRSGWSPDQYIKLQRTIEMMKSAYDTQT